VLFYILGLSRKPHHLRIATAMTCIFLVVIGGSHMLVCRANMKRAIQALDAES